MIHEATHAYIFYKGGNINFTIALQNFAAQNGYSLSDPNRLHHEFMKQYVDAIAYSLYTWDKNYGTGGNLGWNYYQAMAFGGLFQVDINGNIVFETDAFKALIPNSEDRKNIAKIVINEQNGNHLAEGSKC